MMFGLCVSSFFQKGTVPFSLCFTHNDQTKTLARPYYRRCYSRASRVRLLFAQTLYAPQLAFLDVTQLSTSMRVPSIVLESRLFTKLVYSNQGASLWFRAHLDEATLCTLSVCTVWPTAEGSAWLGCPAGFFSSLRALILTRCYPTTGLRREDLSER